MLNGLETSGIEKTAEFYEKFIFIMNYAETREHNKTLASISTSCDKTYLQRRRVRDGIAIRNTVKIRSYIILNGSVSARIIRVAVFPGVVIKSSSIGCVVELFEV